MATPFGSSKIQKSPKEIQGLLSSLSGGQTNKAIGLASDIMWYLSRPYHAVTGGISGLMSGDPTNVAKGLWGGLTGSGKDVYAGDILEKIGIPKGEKLFTVPGFNIPVHTRDILAAPLSFALDPLMYSKIGALSKIGKEREMAMGTLDAAGKLQMGLQPTLAMQLKAGERIPFQMFGHEVPVISDIMKPFLEKTGDAARWLRTRKFMQETFGEVTDPFVKAMERTERSIRSGIVSDIEPQIMFIKKGIEETAKKTGRSEKEIAGFFRKYAEQPTLQIMKKQRKRLGGEIEGLIEQQSKLKDISSLEKEYSLLEKGETKELVKKVIGKTKRQHKRFEKKIDNIIDKIKSIDKKISEGKIFDPDKFVDFLRGDKQFFEIMDTFHDINRQILKIEQYKNIPVSELQDTFSYFPRVATPELRKVLKAKHGREMDKFYSYNDFLNHSLKRIIRGKTIGEVNNIVKKTYNLKGEAFILDPAQAIYSRVQSHAKTVGMVEFLGEAFNVFGRIGKKGSPTVGEFIHLGEHWTHPSSPAIKKIFIRLQREGKLPPALIGIKNYSQVVFPEKISNMLDKTIQLYDNSFKEFTKILDAYNKRFKPMVTVLFPGYHVRNVFDDSIRGHLGGLNLFEKETYSAYKEAWRTQTMASKLHGKNLPAWSRHYSDQMLAKVGKTEKELMKEIVPGIKNVSGKEMTRADLYQELVKNGIIGTGFWDSELWRGYGSMLKDPDTFQRIIRHMESKGQAGQIGGKTIAFFDPITSPVMKGPKKLASAREDLTRAAMYIKLRKEGHSVKAAGNKVMNYLYDYLELGKGDKILKSVIPFYSFTRQNIPFWMSAAAKHPGVFSGMEKIQTAFRNEDDPLFLPKIIKEGIPIQLSNVKQGKATFLYSFGLSMEDLNKIVVQDHWRTLDKLILSSLSPLLKYPLERAADKNFYFSTKISDYQKAYGLLRGMPDSWKDFFDFKEKTSSDGTVYYRMNPYWLHFISNTPLARIYTTVGKANDKERTWGAFILDDIMGVKTKVFDLQQEKKRQIKNSITKYLKEQKIRTGEVREMKIMYVPKEEKENVDPALLELVNIFSKSGKVLK